MQQTMANLVAEWVDSGMMDTEPDKERAKALGRGRPSVPISANVDDRSGGDWCTAETIKVRTKH